MGSQGGRIPLEYLERNKTNLVIFKTITTIINHSRRNLCYQT